MYADSEVRVGLTDLILGNEPEAPQYGRVFRRQRRCGFSRNTRNTSEVLEPSNNPQSISRPVLSVSQLLRKSIRSCLSQTCFDGTELQDDDLREALVKHAECWTGGSIDPSITAAEVYRRVTMGSEATAVGRTDAVQSRLEQ